MNPYLFIVGCPRSGTTLLQRMLDAHPQLAVANDAHFIQHGIRGRTDDAALTDELVDRVTSYRAFERLGVSRDEARMIGAHASTYGDFVRALFDKLAASRGKPYSGEKAPLYARYLPLLDRLFPNVRVIQIVRDGRDVVLSMLDWARPGLGPGRFPLWNDAPVAVAALFWRWHVTTAARDGSARGRRLYHETRYERLLADAATELHALTAFLAVPYAPEMLRYHEGKTREARGLSAKSAWLPPTPGLRDWRTQLAEADVELVEALAGDVLSSYGYERAYPRISPAVRAHAERCRARWEREVQARSGTLASVLDLRIEPTTAMQAARA